MNCEWCNERISFDEEVWFMYDGNDVYLHDYCVVDYCNYDDLVGTCDLCDDVVQYGQEHPETRNHLDCEYDYAHRV
jgi:hypothetical protein